MGSEISLTCLSFLGLKELSSHGSSLPPNRVASARFSNSPCLFSLKMWSWKIAPALASGCTIVFKTAEATPLSVLLLTKLMEEVG